MKKREEKREGVCPFCPGNEDMTPAATLVYIPTADGVRKDMDRNGARHRDWIVRCVPNLYPIFTPPDNKEDPKLQRENTLSRAIGHHEILIESTRHNEHPGTARISQLTHVINACLDRLSYFSTKNYVKYVSIFRNHGQEAGASLSHPHTQLIATPFIPRVQTEELKASRKVWMKEGECVFCSILRREVDGPRFIWEDDNFVVFAPWASVHTYEFWILPKEHKASLSEITSNEIEALAKTIRVSFGGLRSLLNDPPYNFGFHIAPSKLAQDYYHWHLEVYPKLTIWAGLEISNGVFVNTVSPEEASKVLKKVFQSEEARL